jgi:hypothetical protein
VYIRSCAFKGERVESQRERGHTHRHTRI